MNLSVSISKAPEPVLEQKSGSSSPMINCTPETPPKKMEDSNQNSPDKKLKAKKNGNSITKEKKPKSHKPHSAKK